MAVEFLDTCHRLQILYARRIPEFGVMLPRLSFPDDPTRVSDSPP